MALITEDHLEQQCLEWFKELGYVYAFAPDLAPDGTIPPAPHRTLILPLLRVVDTGREMTSKQTSERAANHESRTGPPSDRP